jgi:hypothetical protein
MISSIEQKKQLILLCGGPDRCGKTNILTSLSKDLSIPYFKASDEHKNFLLSQDRFINELRFSDKRMLDMIKQMNLSVICDRAYMCEWVYSQYFQRGTDMPMLAYLDEQYAKLGAHILINTRRSFEGIHDDLKPEMNLNEINKLYLKFTQWTVCKCAIIYVDDECLDKQLNVIKNWVVNGDNSDSYRLSIVSHGIL